MKTCRLCKLELKTKILTKLHRTEINHNKLRKNWINSEVFFISLPSSSPFHFLRRAPFLLAAGSSGSGSSATKQSGWPNARDERIVSSSSVSSSTSVRFSISDVLFWRRSNFCLTWHFGSCDAQSACTFTLHILQRRPCRV